MPSRYRRVASISRCRTRASTCSAEVERSSRKRWPRTAENGPVPIRPPWSSSSSGAIPSQHACFSDFASPPARATYIAPQSIHRQPLIIKPRPSAVHPRPARIDHPIPPAHARRRHGRHAAALRRRRHLRCPAAPLYARAPPGAGCARPASGALQVRPRARHRSGCASCRGEDGYRVSFDFFSFPPPPLLCFYFSVKLLWLKGINGMLVPTLV